MQKFLSGLRVQGYGMMTSQIAEHYTFAVLHAVSVLTMKPLNFKFFTTILVDCSVQPRLPCIHKLNAHFFLVMC
jgi:hypothetical protein